MQFSVRRTLLAPGALLLSLGLTVFAIFLAVSGDGSAPAVADSGHMSMQSSGLTIERTQAAVDFRNSMRKLWEDHITWTRLFIVSDTANLPDLGATTGRLLQNQQDIGDAVKPFYGAAAGNQLAELLRQHILIAADLVNAAKAGDAAAFNDANARWFANADQIARFLHNANPDNWPLQMATDMMHSHLNLTLQEASAHLTGNFAGDVAAYDAVHQEILQMADFLSLGIIHQFPHDFTPNR